MSLPDTYTDKNETGCCPVPNTSAWDRKLIEFDKRFFVRRFTRSLFYQPLNLGKVMTELFEVAQRSQVALPQTQSLILSRDLSPWKAEQLYAVSQPIAGEDNVMLDGTFATRVFEGPYRDAKQWYQQIKDYAREQGYTAKRIFFWYTTCPKCAKHYGKNYVIAVAEVQ